MVDIFAIERALLIGAVRTKNWSVLIQMGINEQHFTVANKPMYKFIKEYTDGNNYPELLLLSNRFNIDEDNMALYTSVDDLPSLCKALMDQFKTDEIFHKLDYLNEHDQEAINDPTSYIQRMNEVCNDLKKLGGTVNTVDLFDGIDDIMTIDPNDVISTGFAELDEALTGWRRGEELVVFVGRTGQGKSWMGLKFAMHAALNGECVGIYSGEMSKQQLQERSLCCAKQKYTSTREEALQFIKDNDLKIPILTQTELRHRATVDDIESFIIKHNLTMLVIDQLSLMDDTSSKPGTPLRQQYGNISMDLFLLSSKYNLPVILLVQSNRAGGQEQDGPGLENIAESDAVAQNATRVITMRNENSVLTLKVVKNRYGESGLLQKYEIDFGINKYKPIKEFNTQIPALKKARARAMFGGPQSTF